VAAHDEGDAFRRVGVESGDGREHVGGKAVVHEGHTCHRADRAEAALQCLESLGSGSEGGGVAGFGDAETEQAGAGDHGVSLVVGARETESLQPWTGEVVVCRDPLDARPELRRPLAKERAVAVGDREIATRLGAGRELVAKVLLDAAVPVEMVRVERRHGDDRR